MKLCEIFSQAIHYMRFTANGMKMETSLSKLTKMREIVILIPEIEAEQNVEIDVRINGRRKTFQYRVELLNWAGTTPEPNERFTLLKHYIDDYDRNWELVEIGAPGASNVPLMFKKRAVISSDPPSKS